MLKDLLHQYHLCFSSEIEEKLEKYQEMLLDWNTRMDLTSVKEGDMAARHFLDSLLPMSEKGLILSKGSLIDVGTGAGFPGLPLAIANPDLKVTLMDAQEKRCKFLRAVAEENDLKNVEILHARAEEGGHMPLLREKFDMATARAVAPMNVLCEYLLPFVKCGGRALCWKGPGAREEVPEAHNAVHMLGGRNEKILPMEYEDEHHVLVVIEKKVKTLPQFPRKNGTPSKRPLK